MEFNSNRKAALAVTAGLVGALTLGGAAVAVAPVSAYAEGADLQSDWTSNATVTRATDGKGATVSNPSKASFAKGSGKFLVPTEVTNGFGTKTDLTKAEDFDFTYSIRKSDGTWQECGGKGCGTVSDGDFSKIAKMFESPDAGTYKVTVKKHQGDTKAFEATFEVEVKTLAGAKQDGEVAYDGVSKWQVSGESESPTAGTKASIAFASSDGEKLAYGKDYKVTAVKRVNSGNTDNPVNGEVIGAGDYKVTLTGMGAYDGSFATVDVKVAKFDLSKATVSVKDLSVKPETGMDADKYLFQADNGEYALDIAGYGEASQYLTSNFKLDALVGPDGKVVEDGKITGYGVYTVTIKAVDNSSNVVAGSKTVEFTNYQTPAGKLFYGNEGIADKGEMTVDLTNGEAWDASKLAVRANELAKPYDGGIEVSYADENDKTVDASALKNQGDYTVKVRVKPSKDASGQWVGGSFSFTVHVKGAGVSAGDDVAVMFGGEQVDGNSVTTVYDAADQLKDFSVVVKDVNGKTYELGKDYTLVVKKDGKEVTEAVDAGTYDVTVKAATFKFGTVGEDGKVSYTSEYKATLNIDKVHIKAAGNGTQKGDLKDQTVDYTSKDLAVPAVQYIVRDAAGSIVKGEDDKPVFAELDKSLYNVVSIRNQKNDTVKAMNAVGNYEVTIALSDAAAGNYDLADNKFTVNVVKRDNFADVDPAAWYAKGVAAAKANKYVNGIAGTDLFAPMADITRADAVCVLFNMAGGSKLHKDDEFSYNDFYGYETGFKDVNGKAYYAKALAWAKAAGVASGYGDGTFKPDAKITREEFAGFLMKYAKSKGDYKAPASDELASMPDKGTVSAWAQTAVNWALSEDVMGNGGFVAGQSSITRAEVATMAVNYQPEPLYDVNAK